MANVSEYEQQANDFLTAAGLEFRAVLVGSDCPRYCPDAEADREMDKVDTFPRRSHIHGKHYRATFSKAGRGHISFDFWNSYADEEQNYFVTHRAFWGADDRLTRQYRGKKRTQVTAYSVLACLQKNDPGSLEDFCGDFGYDTDSRRAEETYRAVVEEWRKVRRFFTAAEMEQLQQIS